MQKTFTYIGIVEESPIITEGLENLLLKSDSTIKTVVIRNVDNLIPNIGIQKFNILIINPTQLINRTSIIKILKTNHPNIHLVGMLHSIFDTQFLLNFDDILYVTDSIETIHNKIKKYQLKTAQKSIANNENSSIELTDREIEVLRKIVHGKSNKEIANVLNISINTVMSHRKNIIQKTHIKSQAGLTVYALNNNILSLESL
jgi:DNA-binding NarL/FixJ family response regulator